MCLIYKMYKIRNAKLEARNIRHKAWTDPLSFVAEISNTKIQIWGLFRISDLVLRISEAYAASWKARCAARSASDTSLSSKD